MTPAPLRVLHVAHGWPPAQLGGTERYAAALAAAQADLGARVARFTPADIVGAPPPRGFADTWGWAGAESAFAAAMGRLRPDVVHLHHLTGLSLRLGPQARERGAAVVLTLHDAWIRCARGQLVDGDGASCAGPEPRRCATCLAPALYAPLPAALARRLPPRVGPLRARGAAADALLAACDLVLAPSPALAARVGIAAEALPYPLFHAPPPAPEPPPGPLRLLFVGSLLPTKGPDLAVEAFARLPPGVATLTLVGPALPYAGSRRWADALIARVASLPGARWAGPLDGAQLDAAYADADVLLFPSTWEENLPFTPREARAAGLRVLATDVPGARAAVPDATFVPAPARPASPSPRAADDPALAAWAAAVAGEVARGRGRQAPPPVSDFRAHAAALLRRYAALVAADGHPPPSSATVPPC